MRSKVTLVLVFLNVALFFFIFKFEREWRTNARLLETRRRVLGSEAADIRTFELIGSVSYRLERRGETWWLTKPYEWPASRDAVDFLTHELQLLEHETGFSAKALAANQQSLADFGLDKPKLTATFTSGEPRAGQSLTSTTLQIGDVTKDGNRLYVLTPDNMIHVVKESFLETLKRPADQLRSDALLTIPVFEARSLAVQTSNPDEAHNAAAPGIKVRLHRQDASRWEFDSPIIARANRTNVEDLITELGALHAVTFNPTPLPATPPSAAPSVRIVIDGNNRREVLCLGEVVTPAARPAGTAVSPGIEYYAQLEGRFPVFTVVVLPKVIEKLRNAQETLREKHIFDFDKNAVTAIALTATNTLQLTLQRLEAADPAEAPWQIVRRGDPAQGPQTQPADRAAVQRLLQKLSDLAANDVNGFVSDAPSALDIENKGFNRPEREVALTLAGAPGAPATTQTVQLGTDSKGDIFARRMPAGSSIYAVDKAIIDELHPESRAWRTRVIRDPLPSNAHFTSLRLTDLSTHAVLLDTAFDASGKPKPTEANAGAIGDILTQMRALHAKAFVQDHFTDLVALAGTERPWRYQLEATAALPGGPSPEPTVTLSLMLTERGGGAQLLAGSKEADAVFEIEQPFVDALFTLTEGRHDPGPPSPPPPPTKAP